jgi:hypothetical protein
VQPEGGEDQSQKASAGHLVLSTVSAGGQLLVKEVETKLRSRLTLENVSVKLGYLRPGNSNIIIQEMTASRFLRFLARRMAD